MPSSGRDDCPRLLTRNLRQTRCSTAVVVSAANRPVWVGRRRARGSGGRSGVAAAGAVVGGVGAAGAARVRRRSGASRCGWRRSRGGRSRSPRSDRTASCRGRTPPGRVPSGCRRSPGRRTLAGRRGPVDVQRRAVVRHRGRGDRQSRELGVDPLRRCRGRCASGSESEPVEQGAHPLVDVVRPRPPAPRPHG